MKVSGKILLFVFILSGLCAPRSEARVYHSDGSAASVLALHNIASDGDTITLPAGTFRWSTTVNLSKAIILQGAGIGRTIVKDGLQTRRFLSWHLRGTRNGAARLTGIEFQDGGRTRNANAPAGVIGFDGSNTNGTTFRLDHCRMAGLNGVTVFNTIIGVVDHNTTDTKAFGGFSIWDSYWNDGTTPYGDRSWTAPTDFGSSQFLFFEDNTYNCTGANIGPMIGAYAGARFVVRHNTIINASISNHGTESSGRIRSGRASEIYNNTWIGKKVGNILAGCRGGVSLFHDNVVSGFFTDPVYFLKNYRSYSSFVIWSGADGTNRWDVNQGPFYSGTASGRNQGSSPSFTVTVSGSPGWTTNQWIGYSVKRTTNLGGAVGPSFALIRGNTQNSLIYATGITGHLSVANGDSLKIFRVDEALDQPGRAGGSLITGNPPALPAGWNDQVTEPCYSWNNVRTDGRGAPAPVNFAHSPEVRQGEHFFDNTPMPGYTPYIYPHPLITARPLTPGAVNDYDFNGDGSPDIVVQDASTGQTAVWYMDNNTRINSAFGPIAGWPVAGVADFNNDGHPDYLVFNPGTRQTAILYLNNNVEISFAFGPTTGAGWNVAGVADFNNDGHPDYLLFNPGTRQTAIWYLNNNVRVSSAFGPTISAGWNVVAP
jgi:VCBS repeat protein